MAIIDELDLHVATRPAAGTTGHPRPADPCRCPEPAVDDETCIWCGHIPREDRDAALERLQLAAVRQERRRAADYLSRIRWGD